MSTIDPHQFFLYNQEIICKILEDHESKWNDYYYNLRYSYMVDDLLSVDDEEQNEA